MMRPFDPEAISRRKFLAAAAVAPVVLAYPSSSQAVAAQSPRRLVLDHTHTGERISLTYHDGREYIPEALQEIEHCLRDFRNDEVHAIDPRLLDLLSGLADTLKPGGRFQIISGYRSPATNAMLRRRSKGVAKHSLHMRGQAIDVRLTGVSTELLRDTALARKRGGVGYYGRTDFVHLDTGRVRRWRG